MPINQCNGKKKLFVKRAGRSIVLFQGRILAGADSGTVYDSQ